MFKNKIVYTISFGYIDKDEDSKNSLIDSNDLFKEELFSSTTIRYIKIWFGTPSGKKKYYNYNWS